MHTDPNESMKGRGEMQKKKSKASFLEMDLIFGPKLNFVKPHCSIGPLTHLIGHLVITLQIFWQCEVESGFNDGIFKWRC